MTIIYQKNKEVLDFLRLPERTACFTGHRPDKVGGYEGDSPLAADVKSALKEMIEAAKASGYRFFISGMALGVDQWAAEMVAADPQLALIAAVPCPGQDSKWKDAARQAYRQQLSQAAVVKETSNSYSPAVMQIRNKWMVDHSSLVLAIWDGDTKGGTFNCVDYAIKKKREILRYNPLTKEVDLVAS